MTAIDINDRIVEAILGPELTRKLDDYIAQEAVLYPHQTRHTRLEVVRGGVETVCGTAQMVIDQRNREEQRKREEEQRKRAEAIAKEEAKEQRKIAKRVTANG